MLKFVGRFFLLQLCAALSIVVLYKGAFEAERWEIIPLFLFGMAITLFYKAIPFFKRYVIITVVVVVFGVGTMFWSTFNSPNPLMALWAFLLGAATLMVVGWLLEMK